MIQRPDTLEAILQAIQGKRILVIGDAMLDNYVWGDASRISPEAPVPVVKVSHETFTAGGAANVALNIAALGGSATLFGWIGDDPSGRRLVEVVRDGGVRVLEGAVSANHETIVKTRIVCRRQQLCRLDREESPDRFALDAATVRDLLAPALREADAAILSDYGKGLVTTASIRAIQEAAPPGLFIALDPKPRAGIAYAGLSVMTPNRAEALRLAGLDEEPGPFPSETVFARIRETFRPEHLVVTMGADGMLIGENGRPVEQIPTVAREVFDVSGAGDTVIAALTLAAAAGVPLGDAAKFANLAAGFVVGKLGTATATPEDIRRYAAEAGA